VQAPAQSIVSLAPEPEGETITVAPQVAGLIPESEGGSGGGLSAPSVVSLVPEAEGAGNAADGPAVLPVSALVGAQSGAENSLVNSAVETNQLASPPAPTTPVAVDQVMVGAENGVGQGGGLEELAAVSAEDLTEPVEPEPVDLALATSDLWLLDS
jgi:hypothetical protein